MEPSVVSGTAQDPSGARFAFIGLSNTPTDWAGVLRALGGDLADAPAPRAAGALTTGGPSEAGAWENSPAAPHARRGTAGPPRMRTTPPSVLGLNAYLMYAAGKAARRRLSERLGARGLRLWHLTVLAMVADLGPQPKGVLASRLDMNASDLAKIVGDLAKAGHVECVRRTGDRRRVDVRLTPEGRSALDDLNADIARADDELMAPLGPAERDQLSSLLRRVHAHLELTRANVVHEGTGHVPAAPVADVVRPRSPEDGRIDWTRPAPEIEALVRRRRGEHPTAYTHHRGRRLELLSAEVSADRYPGRPGLVLPHEPEGVVIVTGPESPRQDDHGLVVHLLRTEDGQEVAAGDYFGTPGTVLRTGG
ncbi:winged helix DNA-binding protein [Streptomyces sp. NPDC047999]|uniref:winged helix DNA-binding protein n=1 Tax=Streptomyces sp. NPDC047999 TaxID=3365497 RepID=UPI00371262B9